MLIKQSIHLDIYTKMKRLYGPHVDKIELHQRPIKDQPGKYGYSAVCSEHGVISEWTRDITTRTIRVRDHLKGAHD